MAVETRTDAAAAETAATPPVNATLSAMDLFILTTPDANPKGIERQFKYSTLTNIQGWEDYERMCIAHEELFRKVIAIKSTFGGGNHGHIGSVSNPELYHTESRNNWTVPTSVGVYPVFPAVTTNDEKKKEVS